MIRTKNNPGSVLVPVRAQAGASRAGVVGEYEGSLKIAVTQPAERGSANEAIRKVLAKALGVRRSAVKLVSGASARDKLFSVEGVSAEDVSRLA